MYEGSAMFAFERHLAFVILSEAKNLADTNALGIVQTQTVHSRDEILRFAQNDKAERVCVTIAIAPFKH